MKISYFKFLNELKKQSHKKNDTLILLPSEGDVLSLKKHLEFLVGKEVLYFPSLDSLPYDRVSPSQRVMSERAYVLSSLLYGTQGRIVISNVINTLQKLPHIDSLKNSYLALNVGDSIILDDILKFLVKNGYNSSPVAVDSGEFSKRGDILDVVIHTGRAYRINFVWDKIESIKEFDPHTQISSNKVLKLELNLSSELILDENKINFYKANFLRNFGVQISDSQYFEKPLLASKIAGIESFAGSFYETYSNLTEYLHSPDIFEFPLTENAIQEYEDEYNDYYASRLSSNKNAGSFYPAFSPNLLKFEVEKYKEICKNSWNISLGYEDEFKSTPNFYQDASLKHSNKTAIELMIDFASENKSKKIIICYSAFSSLEKIKSLFAMSGVKISKIEKLSDAKLYDINVANFEISKGYSSNDYIFISEKEIIGNKIHFNKTSQSRLKSIFKELENFAVGDLVAHVDHGVGKFEGLEQIDFYGSKHDCLLLVYAKGDKLYIPASNIHLIKKYGDNNAELDSLGSVSWQKRKSKLKERIGELALKLINIAAKRKLAHATPIIPDEDLYKAFCDKFPYPETEDQLRAIEDIYNDLTDNKPMDRLICGDVGFGKTEIAMRASFLIATDKMQDRQVVIIVPTTILARQHYENFIERFAGFGLKIRHISRFVSGKDITKYKSEIESGEADIIIGTHALFSETIKFKNLGLLIVDEEQHFGVEQKEKLKQLQDEVHTLTLTATPIPRTLQMSLIGIRDLSLIATAPIDRLAVRTSVIQFDDVVIREALLREKFRGGKSFFVSQKIQDLKDIQDRLEALVPELKIKMAHGQMKPSTIDNIMTEFYEGKFDILLSTAIVESGLDIPSANTMIIYKAENMGLSQLYQLRGRVGRGKQRGYTYLVTDSRKMPTESAVKRLEILQGIDSLGAGFTIASHDMDNRGFGNLVGDEQSGHIKEVGIELYQDMLEEEVSKLQNKEIKTHDLPEINLKLEIYLPHDYIADAQTRLAIYRKAGEIFTFPETLEFEDELIDRFGKLPTQAKNFIELLKLRIKCKEIGIKQIDMASSGFNLKFNQDANQDKIFAFISKNKDRTKIKPDNKLTFLKDLDNLDLVEETKKLVYEFAGFF
jgi:transcription-repair coupling factor (superfamily II helicase)